ncbi:MAG: lipopolysaccharide heptosyltransferase II [Candidatus Firestonebacteria bacterium]|nr:lipopolysaccharide heptosyltransferase II [Candidatus Firestonebacteria bacterium]
MANLTYKRILIIRFSSIGDIILTTPMIRFIKQKFPEARIDFITREYFSNLIEYHPMINQVFTISSGSFLELMSCVSKLKNNNYDLIIDLHSNLRSFIIKQLLFNCKKITYKKDIFKRILLTEFKINLFKNKTHVVERYFKTLSLIDKSIKSFSHLPLPEIYSTPQIENKIKLWLNNLKLEKNEILIGFNPGAKYFTKRWPIDKFIELGHQLKKQFNIRIIIFGGNSDIDVVSEIADGIGEKAVSACEELNLLETFELLKHLRFLITGDTGIMHLAKSANIPVIAIFGPTVLEFGFWPYGKDDVIIEKNLHCRPCSLHGTQECPINTHKCMEDITSNEVLVFCINKLRLIQ